MPLAPDHARGSLVNACLANGRPNAAEFLGRRGARLDLDEAAGVGRLDIVKSFFNEDGSLKGDATKAQMESGWTNLSPMSPTVHSSVCASSRRA